MDRQKQLEKLENRLAINPDDLQAMRRLIAILDALSTKVQSAGHIGSVQTALENELGAGWQSDMLDPARHATAYKGWLELLHSAGIKRGIPVGQIFSGRALTIRGEHAHCNARLKFFKETKVIPGLCHDCYKVQILPENLRAMFQTYFLLINLDLVGDNARKCMIELRDGIKFPYKAYIYCEDVAEAKACLSAFRELQAKFGIKLIHSKISHGCSEYGQEYPDFKYSEELGGSAFDTPKEWRKVEKNYFDKIELPHPNRQSQTKPSIMPRRGLEPPRPYGH